MRRDRVELKEQHRGHTHRLDILGEFGETRLKAPGQRIDKEQDQANSRVTRKYQNVNEMQVL